MHVGKLERQLGVQLLRRTTRGSTLTAAGIEMLPHLRGMLRAEESTQQHAAALAGERVGHVRVAAVNSGVVALLPGAVKTVAQAHPELDVEVEELNSIGVAEGVRDGTYDVGITAQPVDPASGLVMEVVAESELMLVAAEGHSLLDGRPITRELVAQQPFVTLPVGYTLRELAFQYLHPYQVRLAGQALNHDTVRRLVGAGLGVTLLPRVTFEAAGEQHGLAAAPVADHDELTQLAILHPGDAAPPSTQIVVDAIRTIARSRFRDMRPSARG